MRKKKPPAKKARKPVKSRKPVKARKPVKPVKRPKRTRFVYTATRSGRWSSQAAPQAAPAAMVVDPCTCHGAGTCAHCASLPPAACPPSLPQGPCTPLQSTAPGRFVLRSTEGDKTAFMGNASDASDDESTSPEEEWVTTPDQATRLDTAEAVEDVFLKRYRDIHGTYAICEIESPSATATGVPIHSPNGTLHVVKELGTVTEVSNQLRALANDLSDVWGDDFTLEDLLERITAADEDELALRIGTIPTRINKALIRAAAQAEIDKSGRDFLVCQSDLMY